MENLKLKGFQTTEKSINGKLFLKTVFCSKVTSQGINILIGLPNEAVEMALVRLARFHASTYHYTETYPGGKEKLFLDHPWFKFKTFFDIMGEDNTEAVEGWLGSVLMQVRESLKGGGRPELAERLEANARDWLKKARASGTPRAESLRTLSHGDYWYTNIMFK